MKLGFGLYKHMLGEEHFKFAKQCGATHIVAHLVDYFGHNQNRTDQPIGGKEGWGKAGEGKIWELDELLNIKNRIVSHGLEWEAIENFDPSVWHDILLDGPKKQEQIELLKQQIRIVGEAGIRIIGYNFSLAGVAGRITGNFARGGAESVGMDGTDDSAIPAGMVWNMIYNRKEGEGT